MYNRFQTSPARDLYLGPLARGMGMTNIKGVLGTGHWPTNMTQGPPCEGYILGSEPLWGTTNMAQGAAEETQPN